jgi:hypothetical protein
LERVAEDEPAAGVVEGKRAVDDVAVLLQQLPVDFQRGGGQFQQVLLQYQR